MPRLPGWFYDPSNVRNIFCFDHYCARFSSLVVRATTTRTCNHYIYVQPLHIHATTTDTYNHYTYVQPLHVRATTARTCNHCTYMQPLHICATTARTCNHCTYMQPLHICFVKKLLKYTCSIGAFVLEDIS